MQLVVVFVITFLSGPAYMGLDCNVGAAMKKKKSQFVARLKTFGPIGMIVNKNNNEKKPMIYMG